MTYLSHFQQVCQPTLKAEKVNHFVQVNSNGNSNGAKLHFTVCEPTEVFESQVSVTSAPSLPNHDSEESTCNSPTMNSMEPKGLQLDPLKDKLTVGQLKVTTLGSINCSFSHNSLVILILQEAESQ